MTCCLNTREFLLFSSFLALLGATGCTSLGTNSSPLADNNADAKAAAAKEEQKPTFVVQFQTEGGKPQSKPVPLEGDVFVQDALKQTGAFRKYRRMTIDLVRITPQGKPHKMIISFDRGKHWVEPQCNYQVRPGDTLIITEDKSNIVDDMLNAVGGPFSRKPPNAGRLAVSG